MSRLHNNWDYCNTRTEQLEHLPAGFYGCATTFKIQSEQILCSDNAALYVLPVVFLSHYIAASAGAGGYMNGQMLPLYQTNVEEVGAIFPQPSYCFIINNSS